MNMAAVGMSNLRKLRTKAIRGGVARAAASPATAAAPGPTRVVLRHGADPPLAVEVSAAPPSSESTARLPSLERVQWEYIHAVLESCAGNVSEAARQLGIHRQSLQRMLRRLPPIR
jgi:transcriptional regulator of acetoin/glycerol metabolism